MPEETPEQTVDRSISAHNRNDAAALSECFALDARFASLKGNILLDGRGSLKNFYAQFFEGRPGAHCEIVKRAVFANYVVDQQRIASPGSPEMNAMVVSQVEHGLIAYQCYAPLPAAGQPAKPPHLT